MPVMSDQNRSRIHECGSLKSWQDMAVFAERLFCEADKLRVLCEQCHTARHLEGETPCEKT